MFREEAIYLDLEFNSQEEMFKKMSQIFVEQDYVREDYFDGLKEREAKFPTGLPNKVAIPHLSGEYAKDNLIVYIRLKNTIPFIEMGSEDVVLDVRHVFFLIFKEGNGHIDALTQIIALIQEESQLDILSEGKSKKEICNYLNQKIGRKD